jgi:hypothetical protein
MQDFARNDRVPARIQDLHQVAFGRRIGIFGQFFWELFWLGRIEFSVNDCTDAFGLRCQSIVQRRHETVGDYEPDSFSENSQAG